VFGILESNIATLLGRPCSVKESKQRLNLPWRVHTSVAREQQQRQLGRSALLFTGQLSAQGIVPKCVSLQILGRPFQ